MTTETLTTEDKVRTLSLLTNRDEAGRHFTERYPDEVIAELESFGLVSIERPIHEPTGISYSQQYWVLDVTDAGRELVEMYPEFWGNPSDA